ncbi:MAG: DUF1573 domain-containing protein [Planctomyces sp.]|nr:DUF1573 domain-containing protein [Planctomyces sp.]
MRPTAVIGLIVAMAASLSAISWLTSYNAPNSKAASEAEAKMRDAAMGPFAGRENDDGTHDPKHDQGHTHALEDHERGVSENPFDLTGKGPHPRAEVPEQVYEFPQMVFGREGEHVFEIKNTGAAPLRLAKGGSTCKCTIPTVKDNDGIPPGGSITVTLRWKPAQPDPKFRQQATVWTNDPENSRIDLTIEGQVAAEGIQVPAASLNFNDVRQGQAKSQTAYIFASQRTDVEILGVETSSDRITVDVSTASEEEAQKNHAVGGYKFDVTVLPSNEIGLVREYFIVQTNLEFSPNFRWEITGQRPGPLKIIGSSWYAARQLVSLGRFQASEGASRKLSVFLDKADEPATLVNVETTSPVQIRLEHDPQFDNADRERYWLYVDFPKGGRTGNFTMEDPARLILQTTHPNAPAVQINVSYEAL